MILSCSIRCAIMPPALPSAGLRLAVKSGAVVWAVGSSGSFLGVTGPLGVGFRAVLPPSSGLATWLKPSAKPPSNRTIA